MPFFHKKVLFLASIECCPKFLEYALTHNPYWAIPEKKTRGVEDMKFPGVLKKEHVEIQGVS